MDGGEGSTDVAVAVVVATRNRSERLQALLDSLRRQTVGTGAFELVVVDDGSHDDTAATLERERARGEFALTAIHRHRSAGPATARDEGWRRTRAPLVAFTDDDCVVDERWLELALAEHRAHPDAIVQGRTDPNPDELHKLSPFARTIIVHEPGPPWETCNIFYPRRVLENVDGFDHSWPLPGGEDTDLAWRAVQRGAEVRFRPEVRVYHGVIEEGPIGMLRFASRWHATVPVWARYPELRRRSLHRGVFYTSVHEHYLLALLGLLLPRRLWWLKLLLAAPYLKRLSWRPKGPLAAPYLIVYDTVEVAAIVRGAIRSRVLVL